MVQIPQKKRWPIQPPQTPQLELEAPTLEHTVLENVDLSGCAEWDPKDEQEAWSILRENADIFAKDNLDLGWTSIMKHKITLEEGARPLKECYRRVPPGLYNEV